MPICVPFVTAILGAILSAVLGAVVAHALAGWRERDTLKRNAATKFRSAFVEAVTQINNNDAHFLMNQAQVQHDAAICEFRQFIDSNQLKKFDKAVESFRQCRSTLVPASLAVWESIGSGNPIDDSDTFALKNALNELLAFADSAQ